MPQVPVEPIPVATPAPSANKIRPVVWIVGAIGASLVACLLCIFVLPLIIGTAFLAWDYHQHDNKELPSVPKLTGQPPGAPKPEGGAKDAAKKDADKKDGMP